MIYILKNEDLYLYHGQSIFLSSLHVYHTYAGVEKMKGLYRMNLCRLYSEQQGRVGVILPAIRGSSALCLHLQQLQRLNGTMAG